MKAENCITIIRILAGVVILICGCDSNVTCRNDQGEEVDWFVLYKLPKKKQNDGLAHFYMDESTNGWIFSSEKISSPSGSLGRTLKPLLDFYIKQTEKFGYLLYNDQPPNQNSVSQSYGHSKGIVMLDKESGVWLSHSTPKFPQYRSQKFWSDNGNTNAQTFMCVSLAYKQFKTVGQQLKFIHPYSYDSELPLTFHQELRCVAQRDCYPKKEPWFNVVNLTSLGNKKLISFAKYTQYKDDLYSGLIANYAPGDLFVKSWGKLREPLASNCSIPHHVYNVKDVNLTRKISFSDTMDHSKWCVTSDRTTPESSLTCIADMNREESQMKRGGGAICTDDSEVARVFRSSVLHFEPCKQTYSHKTEL